MRSSTTALALAVAMALAGTLIASGAAAPERADARAKFVKCGKVGLGFTKAKVRSRGMKCRGAKLVFRKWRRKVNCPNDPCERVAVENFVCRFGGTTVARLRCNHSFRDQRAMKARWGD
ncbi:MAG: hypothetical protein ACRDK9_00410 [Solirubrobacterales bacterium]